MARRGTVVGDRPSTQVDARPARLPRRVVGVLVLVVAALAIGLVLVLASDGEVPPQEAPAADTEVAPAADTAEIPYTGDWKDSLIEVERSKEGAG